ncbi:unknown [Coraliomargarita sp. CAG:312]|nr:unknown [Coraliomargarita sp. CAG:312]
MKALINSLFLCLMLIFCGCASEVQFYPMSPGYAGEPVPLEDVQLFITQKPPYKYKELGMVTYNTSGGYPQNEIDIYQKLREKAAQIGASGVIIMNSQSAVQSFPSYSVDMYGNLVETSNIYSNTLYRGMAIKRL